MDKLMDETSIKVSPLDFQIYISGGEKCACGTIYLIKRGKIKTVNKK